MWPNDGTPSCTAIMHVFLSLHCHILQGPLCTHLAHNYAVILLFSLFHCFLHKEYAHFKELILTKALRPNFYAVDTINPCTKYFVSKKLFPWDPLYLHAAHERSVPSAMSNIQISRYLGPYTV